MVLSQRVERRLRSPAFDPAHSGICSARATAQPAMATDLLVVSWDRLLPGFRTHHLPIAQQDSGVLVEERMSITRELMVPAPGQ